MITLEKIKIFICFNFVTWMLVTSVYTWFMLGLKHQSLPLLANISFLTEDREIKLFQRERGGVRRIGNNSQKNITKVTLSKTV
jgi:hypothetical protein